MESSEKCHNILKHWKNTTSFQLHRVKVHLFATPWTIQSMEFSRPGVGNLFLLQGSSQPRDRTQVSHIAGGFFTNWATGKPKNSGVGSLSLLLWIFPTQELNQDLLHCRQILYQLSHRESPRILEWVAHPFSRGSSQPRNQTRVSCIAGRFFTNWAIGEHDKLIFTPNGNPLQYSCLENPMDRGAW